MTGINIVQLMACDPPKNTCVGRTVKKISIYTNTFRMVRVDFKQLTCFNYKLKKRTYDLVSLSEVQM